MLLKPLYNLGLVLYNAAIALAAATGAKKARLLLKGRRETFSVLGAFQGNPAHKLLWFHVASLGEFEQGRPVIELIKRQNPQVQIALSFFSPSGFEPRKNYPQADVVFYLPSDSPDHARKVFDALAPDAVLFVKYEYWYHYFQEAHRRQIPLYMVSAHYRQDSIFSKWYGGLHRKMLGMVRHFFVQDVPSAAQLAAWGFANSTVTGDTRVDRVLAAVEELKGKPFPAIEEWLGSRKADLVAGSLYHAENQMLCKVLSRELEGKKIILVPHVVEGYYIKKLASQWPEGAVLLLSELEEGQRKQAPILMVDSVGQLMHLYKYARLALVGGGFGNGIHNTLEPAAWGLPLLFGPKYRKFPEAVWFLEQRGAVVFENAGELDQALERFSDTGENVGQTNRQYLGMNAGGSRKVFEHLRNDGLFTVSAVLSATGGAPSRSPRN